MKPRFDRKKLRDKDAPPKVRRAPGSPTKSQLRAIAAADARARVMQWRNLIPVAKTTWSKIDALEFNRVEGNVHVLAGLVQMRYQLSRIEADKQVKAFFDKHAPTPAAAPVAKPVLSPVIVAPEAGVVVAAGAEAAA